MRGGFGRPASLPRTKGGSMSAPAPRVEYLATANDTCQFGGAGGGYIHSITIGTVAASAVVTVYDGTSTSGRVVATIDASVYGPSPYPFFGARLGGGVFVKLTGGNAKVTVVGA